MSSFNLFLLSEMSRNFDVAQTIMAIINRNLSLNYRSMPLDGKCSKVYGLRITNWLAVSS